MWEQNLKQREEEWKEELKRKEEKVNERMKASLEAFYSNQIKRDVELLYHIKKERSRYGKEYVEENKGLQISVQGAVQRVWKVNE